MPTQRKTEKYIFYIQLHFLPKQMHFLTSNQMNTKKKATLEFPGRDMHDLGMTFLKQRFHAD